MQRKLIAAVLGAVAILVAVLIGSASARSGQTYKVRGHAALAVIQQKGRNQIAAGTLKLVGFSTGPRPSSLRFTSGAAVAHCSASATLALTCTVTLFQRAGTITFHAQGKETVSGKTFQAQGEGPITGAAGVYHGAKGTMSFKGGSATSARVTPYTIKGTFSLSH